MRWESEVKHAELTPARAWSKRDDGNFGGRSLLTPDENALSHYGVPGMKWGVTTKEYVKKGYDTLKRRQAILKQKRKAEAKAQYEEGYRRGQRVASNTSLIKDHVSSVLKRKREQEEGSLSDRAVNKAFDFAMKKTELDKTAKNYGLDQYIPQAKDFLKNKKDDLIENLYDYLEGEAGRKSLQKVANFMARGVSASVRAGYKIAPSIRRGRRIARSAAKSATKAATKAVGRSMKSGYKWLREGNPSGAKRIQNRVRSAEKTISRYGQNAANALSIGAQSVHQSARTAHRQLNTLLARRRRRAQS